MFNHKVKLKIHAPRLRPSAAKNILSVGQAAFVGLKDQYNYEPIDISGLFFLSFEGLAKAPYIAFLNEAHASAVCSFTCL